MRNAVEWYRDCYGEDGVHLLTLTVRHALGQDAATIRKGVSEAWRLMQGGAPWKRFEQSVGLFGTIRALEITVGPNGFHPHLHIIVLAKKLDAEALELARRRLSERWQRVVARTLGVEHVPDDAIGCDLRSCAQADYIAKLGLGLEIAGAPSKVGRGANLTPLEVAERFVETGDAADLATWRSFCKGMYRARMLTWSKGLRDAAGLGTDKSDEAVVEEMEAIPAEVIYTIHRAVWDRVRDVRGASSRLLEAADALGRAGVMQCLAILQGQATSREYRGMSRYG